MNVVVAGSREGVPEYVVTGVLSLLFPVDGPTVRVVSGLARGVDQHGMVWARRRGYAIIPVAAQWKTDDGFNDRAGHERNVHMAMIGDVLVAFWDGKSPGTRHMISSMRRAGKPRLIVTWEPPDEAWALD